MALQNLKAEMRRKGITQAQVAKSLGMSETISVSNVMSVSR